MAHTKSGGSTKLGRDSASKRLGVKKHDGQIINQGEVIIRQRGTKYHPGPGVRRGADDTLYAALSGIISFTAKSKTKFNGQRRRVTVVSVKSR